MPYTTTICNAETPQVMVWAAQHETPRMRKHAAGVTASASRSRVAAKCYSYSLRNISTASFEFSLTSGLAVGMVLMLAIGIWLLELLLSLTTFTHVATLD